MQKKIHFKKRCRQLIFAVCIFVLYVIISIFCSNHCLKTTEYKIKTDKITSSITIVQLTDIHDRQFWESNIKLISKIKDYKPDIIVITGDIINSEDNETEKMETLLLQLNDIAPIYISLGNQETEYMDRTGIDLVKRFSQTGAIVVNKNYVDVSIKGQSIRIGGIYGYCLPEQYHSNSDEVQFLRSFEDTKNYKILLSHLPYAWVHYGFTKDYDIDLIFTGHLHGGQVILPFFGGLYDPEFGFFPDRLKGIYYENNSISILSSGLGSDKEKLPRFNNIPEIVVAKINDNN